jgi:RNA polymerase sigma-70 factor (ECF subfamily)
MREHMANDQQEDRRLLGELRRGSRVALAALYDRHERRLFGFILSFLPNRQDAEEVLQDTFMSLLTSDAAPESVEAWLLTVARHRALNRLRSRRTAHASAPALQLATAPVEPTDAAVEGDHRAAALAAAVTRLPPALGEVYRLRAAGHSYEEMAERLEVPIGTIKSRVHALVQRLRKELRLWLAT